MKFERHMSDNEALMWNLEKDPALSSWFASITILDTVPSVDRLRSRLAVAVADIDRLRQRVVPSALLDSGFKFQWPDLGSAMQDML